MPTISPTSINSYDVKSYNPVTGWEVIRRTQGYETFYILTDEDEGFRLEMTMVQVSLTWILCASDVTEPPYCTVIFMYYWYNLQCVWDTWCVLCYIIIDIGKKCMPLHLQCQILVSKNSSNMLQWNPELYNGHHWDQYMILAIIEGWPQIRDFICTVSMEWGPRWMAIIEGWPLIRGAH